MGYTCGDCNYSCNISYGRGKCSKRNKSINTSDSACSYFLDMETGGHDCYECEYYVEKSTLFGSTKQWCEKKNREISQYDKACSYFVDY